MKTVPKSKVLNIILWVVQVLLAGMFIMAGIMKSTSPIEQLSASLPWAKDVPAWLVRFIGVSEILGALGLLLPSILRIKPILTPVAASGIIAIMLMASVFHITRSEFPELGFTLLLALAAAFIAWGRSRKVAITVKNK